MKNEPLKIRASRLRVAIKEVLGRDISMSQSLELVAKEENYHNWDQASALYKEEAAPAPTIPTIDAVYSSLNLVRRNYPFEPKSVYQLFKNDFETLKVVHELLSPTREQGALIVIGGLTGSGKSTTMYELIKDHCARHKKSRFDFYHAGTIENKYPDNVNLRHEKELIMGHFQHGLTHRYVVINEINDHYHQESLYTAMMLVKRGYKVLFTHHSRSCAESIVQMSKSLSFIPHAGRVKADSLLAELVSEGCVRVINQTMRTEKVFDVYLTPQMNALQLKKNIDFGLRSDADTIHIIIEAGTTDDMIGWAREIAKSVEQRGFRIDWSYVDGEVQPPQVKPQA
jgi:Tfp pilus assembly pilus retraction ATPase PilT